MSPQHVRQSILDKALAAARVYLYARDQGQSDSREQKEMIENVLATDYDGRTVIELLQNAHDAHPQDQQQGRIEILLDASEGDFGVLYVGNGGNVFRAEDFDAICRIGLSSKQPSEGIGNKGVGFKSVLQLCRSPEIYSVATPDSSVFDGYCFRFATHEDFEALASILDARSPNLASELVANLSALKVPFGLTVVPPAVERLRDAGCVTVARLPMRSAEACDRARIEIEEMLASEAPIHLFLDRIADLTVTLQERTATVFSLTRTSEPLGKADGLRTEFVRLDDDREFVVLHGEVPESEVIEAITMSRDAARIGSSWSSWQGPARVSIALPAGRAIERGRLYTFLPMAEAAGCPIRGFVNAPFYARLNRMNLEFGVPLNARLLEALGRACAAAVMDGPNGDLQLTGDHLVDLLTWTPERREVLERAFAELGTSSAVQRCVRTLGGDGAHASLLELHTWPFNTRVVTDIRIASEANVAFIAPDLDDIRVAALTELAVNFGRSLSPGREAIADWAERAAASLARDGAVGADWADFFDDVEVMRLTSQELRGKRLVPLDASNDLGVCGGPLEYFFPPRQADGEVQLDAQAPVDLDALAFVRNDIQWTTNVGTTRKLRLGRSWLEKEGIVRPFRTRAVLDLVGRAMAHPERSNDSNWRLLAFACSIWAGGRDVGDEFVRSANLRVPTPSGWVPATQAVFSPGWDPEFEDVAKTLKRLVATASRKSVDLAELGSRTVVESTDVPHGISLPSRFAEFLRSAGVADGLLPQWIEPGPTSLTGGLVNRPNGLQIVPGLGVPNARIANWLAVGPKLGGSDARYESTEYKPEGPIAVLPGQFEFDEFDDGEKRLYADLIVRGLASWSDDVLTFRWTRHSDKVGARWRSFAGAFLASESWVPQTTPQARTKVFFVRPRDAWWLSDGDAPDFLPAQPGAYRRVVHGADALSRVRGLGIRIWDSPESARARLTGILDIVRSQHGRLGSGVAPQLRKAYEVAWVDEFASGSAASRAEWVAGLTDVLVTNGGVLRVQRLEVGGPIVYVPDGGGAQQWAALVAQSVNCLNVRDVSLADQVASALEGISAGQLKRASDAKMELRSAGRPTAGLHSEPLIGPESDWIVDLAAAVIEYKSQTLRSPTSEAIQRARNAIRGMRIALASQVTLYVDGRPAHSDGRGAWIDPVVPNTIVVEVGPDVDVTQAAASTIMAACGFPNLGDNFKLALIEINPCVTRGATPTRSDIGRVLRVPAVELQSLLDDAIVPAAVFADVTRVVACVDENAALALLDDEGTLSDRGTLTHWLADLNIAIGGANPIKACEDGFAVEHLSELGVTLAEANARWERLGLEPMHNVDGHSMQFAAYLNRVKAEVVDALRRTWLPVYRDRGDLGRYLELKALPSLGPDEAWLDSFWDLDDHLMALHVGRWMRANDIDASTEVPLEGLREVLTKNREMLRRTLRHADPIISLWCRRNGVDRSPPRIEFDSVHGALLESGQLDFEVLRRDRLIGQLHELGVWPEGMPHSLRLKELGLTAEDLVAERELIAGDARRATRARKTVDYGERSFQLDDDGLRALATTVIDAQASGAASVSVVPFVLPKPVHNPPAGREVFGGEHGIDHGGGRPDGAGRAQAHRVEERFPAIGIAGEAYAAAHFEREFGLQMEETWCSGFRDLYLGDGLGDDSLGFDFRLQLPDRVLLVEVKSTTGTTTEFHLGETQVRRAQQLGPNEEFRIFFVMNALTKGHEEAVWLPNPFGPNGLDGFTMLGQEMRLGFVLPEQAE